jgi:uncharacterized membrane protein
MVDNRKQAPDAELSRPAPQSTAGCLIRLFWMIGGTTALYLSAMFIAQGPSGFSVHDLAYWGVAFLLVAARYVDITRLDGTTAHGEPATLSHWRRYTLAVLGLCTALWVVAHLASFLIHP